MKKRYFRNKDSSTNGNKVGSVNKQSHRLSEVTEQNLDKAQRGGTDNYKNKNKVVKQQVREFCDYVAELRQQKADIMANRGNYVAPYYDHEPILVARDSCAYGTLYTWNGNRTITNYQADGNRFANDLLACISKLDELGPRVYIADMIVDKERQIEEVRKKNEHTEDAIRDEVLKIQTLQPHMEKIEQEMLVLRVEDKIKEFSLQQRAHILSKIWDKDDDNSLIQKIVIIEEGFDGNYRAKNGISLLNIAIDTGDSELLTILMNNKLDFNKEVGDKTVMQMILSSGKELFIVQMLTTEADFDCAISKLIREDDVTNINKIYQINSKILIGYNYEGMGILQSAMYAKSYKVMDLLVNSNSDLYKQLVKDDSLLNMAINLGDEKAIQLLQLDEVYYIRKLEKVSFRPMSYSKDKLDAFEKTLDSMPLVYDKKSILKQALDEQELYNIVGRAVVEDKISLVKKLVNILPDRIHDLATTGSERMIEKCSVKEIATLQDELGNNLVHLACKYDNKKLLKSLLDNNRELVDSVNNAGQTLLHVLIDDTHFMEKARIDITKIIAVHHPNLNIKDHNDHTVVDLLGTKHLGMLTILHEYDLVSGDLLNTQRTSTDNVSAITTSRYSTTNIIDKFYTTDMATHEHELAGNYADYL